MTDIRRFCFDDETGEILTYNVNQETGEPVVENSLVTPRTTYTRPRSVRSIPKRKRTIPFPKGYMTKTRKFQLLKDRIMAGSNTISHRLLLVPTLVFFSEFVCILLLILEVFIHMKCHKKNKSLKDPTMYFRSPFHAVTSIFCGVCRESYATSKVGLLQDQRRNRYDYFHEIRGVI